MPRFSNRLPQNLSLNKFSETLESLAQAPKSLINLNPTELNLCLPQSILNDCFKDIAWSHYEPTPSGLSVAKYAIKNYYETRNINIKTEQVLITASTSEAYTHLFKLYTNPGDGVLVPRPGYPLFDGLAENECLKTYPYELQYNGEWELNSLSLPSTEEIKKNNIKIMIIVNPNNPTGHAFKDHEINFLHRYLQENDLVLISDEVFLDYATHFKSLANCHQLHKDVSVFVLSGISKVLALPGLKLSWILIYGNNSNQSQTLEKLEYLNDLYLNANYPVQAALPKLMKHVELVQNSLRNRITENLEILKVFKNKTSVLELLPYESGWYGLIKTPATWDDISSAQKLMIEKNMLLHPGAFYDFYQKNFWVLSLLTPPAYMESFVESQTQFWN